MNCPTHSGRNTKPMLTIQNTEEYCIRVDTRYVCDDGGHRLEALDVNMGNPRYLVEVICPGCHRNVLSISRHTR
jgi:hypothetical protein